METYEQYLEFKKKYEELQSEMNDLQVLYENNLDHSSSLENELMDQNKATEELRDKMKKYLSPQLYQALLGGTTSADTKVHARKKLVIYFSDVVGFSDLTDTIEPELLSDVLNSYLTRMSEIALKYGGTVDKFIGDAIMVFFGDPEYIDDTTHARQCVAMALEMREQHFLLRETWKAKGIDRTIQVRAGINIGYCTVGNFGSDYRMDYTIVGGQVNVASRLQSAAPPDSIYLSRQVFVLVEDFVQTRHIGPVSLKGIHAPIEVYEALRLVDGAHSDAIGHLAQISEDKIQLKALDIDLVQASDAEILDIQKALSQVLVGISTRHKS